MRDTISYHAYFLFTKLYNVISERVSGITKYKANQLHFFFLMALITVYTDAMPAKNAQKVPTDTQAQLIVTPNLNALYPSTTAPPTITGTDSKKENSAASEELTPKNFIVDMVAPLRDSPGKTATPCATPVIRDGKKPVC